MDYGCLAHRPCKIWLLPVRSFQGELLGSVMALVSQRRQVMAFHGPAASQHAILVAAATVPYYTPVVPAQDVQPDRPIGYGAFGVVW